nr:RecName: Full=Uncharacterized protein IMPP12 [Nautilus macromphalus]
LSVNYQWLVR